MMRTTLFAGIDPAIGNTGVVVLDAAGNLMQALNTKFLKSSLKTDTPYRHLLRLDVIANQVTSGIEACMPSPGEPGTEVYIGYENYSFDSENKAFTIGELGGVLRLALVKRFGHLHLVEPSVLKKFATGHGQAKKEQMMQQAKRESEAIAGLSDRQLTSDVCDAFHLAKYTWYRHAPDQVVYYEKHRQMLRMRLELARRNPAKA